MSMLSATSALSAGIVIASPGHAAEPTQAIALGDLNGDGRLDLVEGRVGADRVFSNDGSGRFTPMYTAADADDTRGIAVGDVNRDGSVDFVAVSPNAGAKLYLNDGTGTRYAVQPVTRTARGGAAVALADIDGDGFPDVVIAAAAGGGGDMNALLVLNTGDPLAPFGRDGAEAVALDVGAVDADTDTDADAGIAVGDVDNDGDEDVVVVSGGSIRLHLNAGRSGACGESAAVCFVSAQVGPDDPVGGHAGALADVDGDGSLDLVVVGAGADDGGRIFFGRPGRPDEDPFTEPALAFVAADGDAAAVDVASADVDNDGMPDVVVAMSGAASRVDGTPVAFPGPGTDLRWRAFLRSASPLDAGALSIDALELSPNARPVAMPDDYVVHASGVLETAPPGVLGNDRDIDRDALSAELIDGARHGTLILRADGAFRYAPDAGFLGTDTFTYQANDGTRSIPATVTIGVTDVGAPAGGRVKDVRASVSTLNAYTPPPGHTACDADDATPQSGVVKPGGDSSTMAIGDNALREHVEPVQINLIGPPCLIVEQGNTFIDPGASAYTPVFGDLTDDIQVHNPVDSNVVGTYTVTYFVRDPDSFEAMIQRTVFVRAAGGQQAPATGGGGGGGGGGGASGGVELLMLLCLAALAARQRSRRIGCARSRIGSWASDCRNAG